MGLAFDVSDGRSLLDAQFGDFDVHRRNFRRIGQLGRFSPTGAIRFRRGFRPAGLFVGASALSGGFSRIAFHQSPKHRGVGRIVVAKQFCSSVRIENLVGAVPVGHRGTLGFRSVFLDSLFAC